MSKDFQGTPIFSENELADQPAPDLPPPGAARREVLAERSDKLAEASEKLSESVERVPVDPGHKALDPEQNREIQHAVQTGMLDVVNPQPGYTYKWENYVNQHGSAVWAAKGEGWQVVDSSCPESPDCRAADGTRKIGDVLLLRMRIDRHLLLRKKQRDRQLRVQYGADAELRELVDKNPGGLKIRDDLSQTDIGSAAKSGAARTALRHLGNKMKKGLVPGIPLT